MASRGKNSASGQKGHSPDKEGLADLCRHHGIELTSLEADKLWAFHELLRLRTRELNLTRIHNFENMVAKLYVDSMIVANLIDLPSPLLDIGSGAGFPAIPLKIIRPELFIIMAEGRKKRAAFLEEAVDLLELENIEVEARKIDERFDRPVAGVITRALEKAQDTLKRIKTFLEPGGLAIFMKGPACDEETAVACEEESGDFELVKDEPYTILHTPHRRRLLVFRSIRTHKAPAPDGFEGRTKDISSSSNNTFTTFKKLLTARGIRKAEMALMSGKRVVKETISCHPDRCAGWISRTGGEAPPTGMPEHFTWYRMDSKLFEELDIFGTKSPLLLIELPSMPAWTAPGQGADGCTLFIPFQDPENVGAVIRSAAAFDVSEVVCLQEAAHPFLPKSCRAAGSSLLDLPLFSGPFLNELDTGSLPLFALSPAGQNIRSFSFPERFGLVAGLEGEGLPIRYGKENSLSIPMKPGVDSLNAAAAVSVALYAWGGGRRLEEEKKENHG